MIDPINQPVPYERALRDMWGFLHRGVDEDCVPPYPGEALALLQVTAFVQQATFEKDIDDPHLDQLRALKEVQFAHQIVSTCLLDDLLCDAIFGDMPDTGAEWMSVLCWMLKHEHCRTFEKNLAKLRLAITARAGAEQETIKRHQHRGAQS